MTQYYKSDIHAYVEPCGAFKMSSMVKQRAERTDEQQLSRVELS